MPVSYSSVIEDIKSRCNIVDVVSSVVPLKRAGVNYKGICPFHSEKTPSFIVSESKQIFTCFGCGASGDAIEFVRRYNNLTFSEAVEKLAAQYGIEVDTYQTRQNKSKAPYYEINRQAAHYFYDSIKDGKSKGYAYLHGREIKNETITKFGIGWADDSWQGLTDYLINKKTEKEKMLELGLCSKGKDGRVFDKFRSRVIFPIIDTRGKVIGFGGRIVGEGDPKYLNSPESPVFQKKYNLYGLNLSREEIQKEGCAIMVEGYMDVVSLYQAGIKNVAASLGTALTPEQAKLLKRYTDKVVLCYDADSAGIQAALRGIDILRAAELDVRVLHVDDGKDPDEYIKKHGPDEFRKLVNEKAMPDVDYRIMRIREQYDINKTTEGVKFLKGVARVLRALSPAEADLYIKKISADYKISEGALRREVNADEAAAVIAETEQKEEEPRLPRAQLLMEKTLIRLALLKSEYFDSLKDYTEAFVSSEGLHILYEMEKSYEEGTDFDIDRLKESLDDKSGNYIDVILKEIKIGGDDKKAFDDCRAKLDKMRTDKRKNEIYVLLELAGDEGQSEVQQKLMEELKQLQLKK